MERSGHRTAPWLSPVLLGIVAWVIASAIVEIVGLDGPAYYLTWLAVAFAAVLFGTIVLVPRRRRAANRSPCRRASP